MGNVAGGGLGIFLDFRLAVRITAPRNKPSRFAGLFHLVVVFGIDRCCHRGIWGFLEDAAWISIQHFADSLGPSPVLVEQRIYLPVQGYPGGPWQKNPFRHLWGRLQSAAEHRAVPNH